MKFNYQFRYKTLAERTYDKNSTFLNSILKDWRDVIEDYLYISRKRINHKLSIFKLQQNILYDLVTFSENLRIYKSENPEVLNHELELLIIVLREIIDGVVWRGFNFNRGFLNVLADNESVNRIYPNKGLISTIVEYHELFLEPNKLVIVNDLSNFLRMADLTILKDNGDIEFIEMKSSKKGSIRKKNPRIRRQKKRMSETVNFFNSGTKEKDDITFEIFTSGIKQKNHLNILDDAIKITRNKGHHSILVGDYMIVELFDYGHIGKSNGENILSQFSSRHKTIKEEWKKNNDFLFPLFYFDKLDFSKNYAPYSIFPFSDEICTDIMVGKLMIRAILNYSEIGRKIRKAGWDVVELYREHDEHSESGLIDYNTYKYCFKISRDDFVYHMPNTIMGRIKFEMLSPDVILKDLESLFQRKTPSSSTFITNNNIDEVNIWK